MWSADKQDAQMLRGLRGGAACRRVGHGTPELRSAPKGVSAAPAPAAARGGGADARAPRAQAAPTAARGRTWRSWAWSATGPTATSSGWAARPTRRAWPRPSRTASRCRCAAAPAGSAALPYPTPPAEAFQDHVKVQMRGAACEQGNTPLERLCPQPAAEAFATRKELCDVGVWVVQSRGGPASERRLRSGRAGAASCLANVQEDLTPPCRT